MREELTWRDVLFIIFFPLIIFGFLVAVLIVEGVTAICYRVRAWLRSCRR